MTTFAFRILVLSLALPLLFASPARAVSIGITDTFQDGTVMNWIVAAGPVGGPHPAPPQNVDNGQGGAADRFLLLTAIGGGGPGGRLTVLNGSQWAGNYLAAGIDRHDVVHTELRHHRWDRHGGTGKRRDLTVIQADEGGVAQR